MSPFIISTPGLQALILILLLLLFLGNFYILAVAITRTRRRWVALTAFACLLLCFAALAPLTAAIHTSFLEKRLPAVAHALARLPTAAYSLFLFLGGALTLLLFNQERKRQRSDLTRSSIKESLDNLPAGLCFANDRGLVLLANRRMDSLCHALTGSDLQDAVGFWDALTQGTLTEGAQRISAGPVIRINGRTWSFSRRTLNTDRPIIQITAVDATDQDALQIRLQNENAALAKLGNRLKRYTQKISMIKAKEERLAIKIRLHNELGFALLATHRLLGLGHHDEKSHVETERVLSLWQRNIALLQGDHTETPAAGPLSATAKALGLRLYQQGDLPQDSDAARLIADFTGECLANALRHAGASALYLELSETPQAYSAVFTNDGAPPSAEVEEGGGLSGLRQRVEAANGTMAVRSQPRFAIVISLPKKGGKNNGPGTNCRK